MTDQLTEDVLDAASGIAFSEFSYVRDASVQDEKELMPTTEKPQ